MSSWGMHNVKVCTGISIFELLAGFSFRALDESRQNFNIRREDFKSKPELEYLLGCRLVESIKKNLPNLDYKRYAILKSITEGDAFWGCDEMSIYSFSIMNMAIDKSNSDVYSFVMPDELFAAFREVDSPAFLNRVKNNSELYDLINGCILSYGVTDSAGLQKTVSKHTSFKFSDERFKEAMAGCEALHGSILVDEPLVYSRCFKEPEYYINEQAKVKEFGYKEFSKEELIHASDVMFVPDNPCYWRLMQLLKRFFKCSDVISRLSAAVLINYAKACRAIDESMEYIFNELGEPTRKFIEEFVPLYCEYNNCTGKWALKGYTPNEMMKMKDPDMYEKMQHIHDKENTPGKVVPFMAH